MPRGPRVDAPDAIHHVIVRGVERRDIFCDDRDRERFLDRLGERILESGTRCYAWALMRNHLHLVLRTGSHETLSKLMQRIGTSHALYFNRRHGRVGHLVQNRFKSLLVEDDAYLRAAVRYVHRNPLAAGAVPTLAALATHPWTGHGALLGRRDVRFEAVADVLRLFAPDPMEARERLIACMGDDTELTVSIERAEAAAQGEVEDLTAAEWCGAARAPARLCPASTPDSSNADLDELVASVCASLGVDPAALRGGRRDQRTSAARAVLARVAVLDRNLPLKTAARALGVSIAAVAKSVTRRPRGGATLPKSQKLKTEDRPVG